MHEKAEPVIVWTVERPDVGHGDARTMPHSSGNVWVCGEAARIERSGSGVAVTFWRGGTGWYPRENVSAGHDAPTQ